MKQSKVIESRIFRIYFDSLYDNNTDRIEHLKREIACVVIADNVVDAIAKAQKAFPGEVIGSAHSDRGNSYSGRIEREKIVI